MSLSAIASYSSHSTDKGSSLLEQSCEDWGADFFDQFLSFDPIDNEDSSYPALLDSTLLARSTREDNIGATASNLLFEDPASTHHTSAPGNHFYTELSGRAAISDSELLSFENISLGSPVSPLSPTIRANSLPSRTSTPISTAAAIARRRARITESFPKIFKKAHSSEKTLRSPIRKSGRSPKMMRGTEHFQNSLDVWGNLFNSKFRFDFEHPVVQSTPPQNAGVSDASDASISAGLMKDSNDNVFGLSDDLHQQLNGRATEYDTPLATPILEGQDSRKTSCQQPFSDPIGFPPTPQFHRSSGTWSQMPGSSEMNSYGTPAIHSPDIDAPVWWNHAATAPMVQPSPTALYTNPQRATKSLAYQLQNAISYDSNGISPSAKMPSGLMIQMPGTPAQQSFVVTSPQMQPPHMPQQGYFGHPQHPPHHQFSPPQGDYVPGAPSHQQHSGSMRDTRSFARHQSESPSPKNTTSNFQIRKRKITKGNKEKKSPSAGAVDFVNFTPGDSRKILTGVAPSGSSKTRARREKEAKDKRRKLSMAALRAVRDAGGDVDSLIEQGLFA
jgi:hypothetical protein